MRRWWRVNYFSEHSNDCVDEMRKKEFGIFGGTGNSNEADATRSNIWFRNLKNRDHFD